MIFELAADCFSRPRLQGQRARLPSAVAAGGASRVRRPLAPTRGGGGGSGGGEVEEIVAIKDDKKLLEKLSEAMAMPTRKLTTCFRKLAALMIGRIPIAVNIGRGRQEKKGPKEKKGKKKNKKKQKKQRQDEARALLRVSVGRGGIYGLLGAVHSSCTCTRLVCQASGPSSDMEQDDIDDLGDYASVRNYMDRWKQAVAEQLKHEVRTSFRDPHSKRNEKRLKKVMASVEGILQRATINGHSLTKIHQKGRTQFKSSKVMAAAKDLCTHCAWMQDQTWEVSKKSVI